MSQISEAIGFNLIVISPTVALVITALILLFFTITIETKMIAVSYTHLTLPTKA